jgi:hypothetical protein
VPKGLSASIVLDLYPTAAEIPREPRLTWRSTTVVAGFDNSARGAVVSVSIRFRLAALLCPPSKAIHGRPAIYRLGI